MKKILLLSFLLLGYSAAAQTEMHCEKQVIKAAIAIGKLNRKRSSSQAIIKVTSGKVLSFNIEERENLGRLDSYTAYVELNTRDTYTVMADFLGTEVKTSECFITQVQLTRIW